MNTKTTTRPANETGTRWTAETWRAHVANHHPSHAANSFAKHREQMGALRPAARVITALTMVGKRVTKDGEPLTFETASAMIDGACANRVVKVARAA